MNYREAWANGEIEAGTLVDAIEELTAELADIKANRDALQLVHRVGRSLDQQRIEMAADNCEVLRARLAKYEDAEGNPIAQPSGVVLPERKQESPSWGYDMGGNYDEGHADGFNACLDEVARLNSSPVSQVEPSATVKQSLTVGGVDERAAFEAWYETTYGISLEPEFRANHFIGYVNDKANHRWTAWQARAALSAPSHGEQVREVVNQCAETCERAKLCSTCAGGLEFPGLPDPGSIAEARIPHHTSDGRQMLWTEVEVIAHKIIQGAIYSWVKDPGNDGGFYAPMMLSFRAAAPSAGSQQGGNV